MAKIRRTTTFDQGFATTEYLAAALLDLAWHTLPVGERPVDVDAFETQALRRYGVDLPLVPPRYRTSYFSHIWSGGYAAGYYAYIWSEVIDADAYAWFLEHGGLTRENGQRFRDMILARGGSGDVAVMYRAFRGRDPEIGRLLDELAPREATLDPDSDDAALLRLARRDHEKAVRVPSSLRADMARAAAEGPAGWAQAEGAAQRSGALLLR